MIDEELQERALEALRIAAALILQDAVDPAVRKLPEGLGQRLAMAEGIAAAGRDVAVLGEACQVLIRRASFRRD